MTAFILAKVMSRKTTPQEDLEAMELLESNGDVIIDDIIAELESRWSMPVTNFYINRMILRLMGGLERSKFPIAPDGI